MKSIGMASKHCAGKGKRARKICMAKYMRGGKSKKRRSRRGKR